MDKVGLVRVIRISRAASREALKKATCEYVEMARNSCDASYAKAESVTLDGGTAWKEEVRKLLGHVQRLEKLILSDNTHATKALSALDEFIRTSPQSPSRRFTS